MFTGSAALDLRGMPNAANAPAASTAPADLVRKSLRPCRLVYACLRDVSSFTSPTVVLADSACGDTPAAARQTRRARFDRAHRRRDDHQHGPWRLDCKQYNL